MLQNIPPLFLALTATLFFSFATIIFTEFSRKVSPLWMNAFKAFVALIAFWITLFFLHHWITPDFKTTIALLGSGCIGLMIADIFMLKAMVDLGASRTLMIFGLQPFFLGIGGFFLFTQKFSALNFLGVALMLACLYTISLEHYKKNGHWHVQGLLFGLIAIFLDAIGVLFTRFGFDHTPGISPIEVNAIRCSGAIIGFILIYFFKEKIQFRPIWKSFTSIEKMRILLGSLAGTYLSLLLYLTAVSRGKLGVISAVTVTGPMFAGLFECFRSKKWPTAYLLIALIFFGGGFVIFFNYN